MPRPRSPVARQIRRRLLIAAGLLVAFAALFVAMCNQEPERDEVVVFAGTSLAGVLAELGAEFEAAYPGVFLSVHTGVSSALARQIEQGARADVLFSASPAWTEYLAARDLLRGPAHAVLGSRLVVIGPAEAPLLGALGDVLAFERIAVADPERVPVGQFAREGFERNRFAEANHALADTAVEAGRWQALMLPVTTLVINISSVALIWFGGLRIDAGQMQVGALIAFLSYFMQILMAVLLATFILVIVPRASVCAERITEVLSTEPQITSPPHPVRPAAIGGEIQLQSATFQYPGAERPVLQDVSLTAQPGTTTAVVGSTGSGKSTLLALICRMYDVTSGSVRIDGVDVRDYDPEQLWSTIGLVPQRGYLFSGTVADNLQLGAPPGQVATVDEMWEALRVAAADDVHGGQVGTDDLPAGRDVAELGEGGGGEVDLHVVGGGELRVGDADEVAAAQEPVQAPAEPVQAAARQTATVVLTTKALSEQTVVALLEEVTADCALNLKVTPDLISNGKFIGAKSEKVKAALEQGRSALAARGRMAAPREGDSNTP